MPDKSILSAGSVSYDVSGGVGTISFGHPKGNSLPGALLAQLAEAVTRAAGDDQVRVVVLRSTGTGAFCAGASFDELKSIDNPESGRRFFMGFATLILAMRRCPKFIITRVQGKAVGGGVGVIAASDYVLASTAAAVRLSELAVGIGPFVVGPVIEKTIGLAAFSALAIDATGWRNADWALRHGLFAETHDGPEALEDAVTGISQQLATSNPEAMAAMKTVFWEGTEHWDALLAARAVTSGTLVLSPFAQQALRR